MTIRNHGDRPMYRNPWVEFERMQEEMERLARGLLGSTPGVGATVYPPLIVSEDADHLYVEAEIPGVASKDLEIALEGDTLTIKGERTQPVGAEGVAYHRRERQHGRFSRAITLPAPVTADGVKARTSDGILHITLPKAAPARPRRITVVEG